MAPQQQPVAVGGFAAIRHAEVSAAPSASQISWTNRKRRPGGAFSPASGSRSRKTMCRLRWQRAL